MNTVLRLSPLAKHPSCARHIYAISKKLYKGDALKNLFWRAMKCTFEAHFDQAIDDFEVGVP